MGADQSDNVVLTQTTFFYDGLGRKKWILEQDVVNNAYLNKRETYYAHDGMDVVRERENVYGTAGQTSTITTTVQQLTRTGNIGGILARTKQVSGQADRPSFYSYDGSGNVISITDASQNVQCAYAYSGFGLEKAQEAAGWEQPYRYSTKWQRGASGLIDYGFRFYNPSWGRWINRDPIAESGGVNLYGMVGNNPTNKLDLLGLETFGYGGEYDISLGPFHHSLGWKTVIGHDQCKKWYEGWSFSPILLSGGFGLGAGLGVSGSGYMETTTARSVSDLLGEGREVGFSIGEGPFVGLAVETGGFSPKAAPKCECDDSNRQWIGFKTSAGLGFGPSPVEVHHDWGLTGGPVWE